MSTQESPLATCLEVPGAKTTLPVSAAKDGFSTEFVNEARKYFNNFHYQMGGDHALYYNLRLSEFLPTAVAARETRRAEPEARPEGTQDTGWQQAPPPQSTWKRRH